MIKTLVTFFACLILCCGLTCLDVYSESVIDESCFSSEIEYPRK